MIRESLLNEKIVDFWSVRLNRWFANQSWIESFQKKIRINFLSLFLQKNSNEIRITNHWFGFVTSSNLDVEIFLPCLDVENCTQCNREECSLLVLVANKKILIRELRINFMNWLQSWFKSWMIWESFLIRKSLLVKKSCLLIQESFFWFAIQGWFANHFKKFKSIFSLRFSIKVVKWLDSWIFDSFLLFFILFLPPWTRACRESKSMIRDSNLVAIDLEKQREKVIRIFFWNDSIQDWFTNQGWFANFWIMNFWFVNQEWYANHHWFTNQSCIESFQKKIRINFLLLFLQKNSNKIRITNHWFRFATSPILHTKSSDGSDLYSNSMLARSH